MQEHQLLDFTERYTAAWCSRDAAGVAAFHSADGSLSVNDGAPAVGRSAITEVAQSFMPAFPDLRAVMDQVLVQRDRAAYHWTLIGANTGPEALDTGSHQWHGDLTDWNGWTHRLLAGPLRCGRVSPPIGTRSLTRENEACEPRSTSGVRVSSHRGKRFHL